jgi:hypothetical protein
MSKEINFEIEKLKDKNLFELWYIFKLSSPNICEEDQASILLAAQQQTIEDFQNGRFSEIQKNSKEYLIKYRSLCQRKIRNAYI